MRRRQWAGVIDMTAKTACARASRGRDEWLASGVKVMFGNIVSAVIIGVVSA
jgi:hypothetical protein